MARARSGRRAIWLLGGLAGLALLVFGGAWLYIHVIQGPAPAPLSLKSGSPSASPSATPGSASPDPGQSSGSVAGTWQVTSGSIVGYRVTEVLAGQNNVAVGRTSDIRGSMTIRGASVTAASFTVQMATIVSNESQRDAQFNGRIMQTATYPTGTLVLKSPISLGSLAPDGTIRPYHATADLTLHGRTRPVTFTIEAERTGAGIEISGSIPILFADWNISNPSFPPFVTTQNHGELEFLIKFSRG